MSEAKGWPCWQYSNLPKNTHTCMCIGHLKENRHSVCVLTHWSKGPTLPQNHLWCDTCWPLDGQPCSRVYLIHVLVQALEGLKSGSSVRRTVHSNHLNHSSSAGAETPSRKCISSPCLLLSSLQGTDKYMRHHMSMAICSHATFHTWPVSNTRLYYNSFF